MFAELRRDRRERDVETSLERVGDVGELAQREVPSPCLDARDVWRPDAHAPRELRLSETFLQTSSAHLEADSRRRRVRHVRARHQARAAIARRAAASDASSPTIWQTRSPLRNAYGKFRAHRSGSASYVTL